MNNIVKLFFCLILLFNFHNNIYSQVTSSSMTAKVYDGYTNEELIGVLVKITHIPTGTVYNVHTNEKGMYNIQGLRPGGPYKIELSYIGFESKQIDNIFIALGDNLSLNIELKEIENEHIINEVIVKADRNKIFNYQKKGASISFSRDDISKTPSVNRSIFDIAKLSPQANALGEGVSFAGANNRYNSFQIDGVLNNDVFGLSKTGTNGGMTGVNPISLEAIDALRIVVSPFDVRQSGFTGATINAITRSGTNDFSASFYSFYNNENFFGKSPGKNVKDAKKINTQYDYTIGASVGGALVKNKLFFFVNTEYTDKTYPNSYYIGNSSNISKSSLDRVLNTIDRISNGRYDAGSYSEFEVPQRSIKSLVRLDWNIMSGHRLSIRYSYLDANKHNYDNTPDKLILSNSTTKDVNQTHSVVSELNSRFSDKLSNEFRIGYTKVRDYRDYLGDAFPSIRIDLSNNQYIQLGADRYSQANELLQDVFTLSDNISLTLGNHNLTLGTSNEFLSINNQYLADSFGSYTYGIDEFETIGTSLEMKPKNYRHQFALSKDIGEYDAVFKVAQLGFYLQDDWTINDKLRLSYGIRMDIPLFFDKPRENTDFNNSILAKELGLNNQLVPSGQFLLSPRLGFRWNILGDNTATLRGGVGVFTGRIPFVWISNNFSKSGNFYGDTYYRKSDEVPNDFKFSSDVNNQYKPQNIKIPRSEIDLVIKNFKFPQIARLNLALDINLPYDIYATLEGLFSKNINDIYYKNVLNKYSHIDGFGRPIFESFDNESKQNYTSLIVLDNTNKGYSYSLSASLRKDFDFGLSANIAYTYSHSYSVFDGLSSNSYNNWQYNQSFYGDYSRDINYSNFDLGHRLVANISYRKEYARYFATNISLLYNGQSGRRFSMTYYGDVNADGSLSNDLVYIPNESELNLMNMSNPDKEAFSKFVNENNEIAKYRGSYIPRNALISPFVQQLDLHLSQEFFFYIMGKKHIIELNADIMNIANIFDNSWGNVYSVKNITPLSLDKKDSSKYTFSPIKGDMWYVDDLNSRWKAQIGLKYKF